MLLDGMCTHIVSSFLPCLWLMCEATWRKFSRKT